MNDEILHFDDINNEIFNNIIDNLYNSLLLKNNNKLNNLNTIEISDNNNLIKTFYYDNKQNKSLIIDFFEYPEIVTDNENKRIKSNSGSIDNLKFRLSGTYRIEAYNYSQSNNIIALSRYNFDNYITKKTELNTNVNFHIASDILPKGLLNLCKKKYNNPFFYNLVNYLQSPANIIPLFKYNSFGMNSPIIVCSLRLINSGFKDNNCLEYVDDSGNKHMVGFKNNIIDIDSVSIGSGVRITKFFNQQYDKNNNKDKPEFMVPETDGKGPILRKDPSGIPIIIWDKDSSLIIPTKDYTLNNTIQYTCYVNLKNTDSTEFDIVNSDLFYSGFKDYIMLQPYPDGGINYYNIGNTNNIDLSICSGFVPSKSEIGIKTELYLNGENLYKQGRSGESELKPGGIRWIKINKGNNLISSEFILFGTLNISIPLSVLDDIREDQRQIWSDINKYVDIDPRCDVYVPKICEKEIANPICACYSTYINNYNSPVFNKDLQNNILTDYSPICNLPECASNLAYKKINEEQNTFCGNVCSSTLNLKTQPFSQIDMNDINIKNTCSNTSLKAEESPCKLLNCPSDSICVQDNNNYICQKKSQCNLKCESDETCNIGKDGKPKCFSNILTKSCNTDDECDSNQKCDTNYKRCINKPPNVALYISIIILSILFTGIAGYFIWYYIMKKMGKTPQFKSLKTLIYFIIIIIIAIFVSIIYYNNTKDLSEKYISININSGKQVCSFTSDCNNDSYCQNNSCNCNIGYYTNNDSCYIDNDGEYVINTICYLPHSVFSGNYFYTTVIDNTIYAFSTQSTFKYSVDKWIELPYIQSSNNKQIGLQATPFLDIINTAKNIYSFYKLCPSLCNTNNKTVYILSPIGSMLNFYNTDKSNTEISTILYYYNVDYNQWNYILLKDEKNVIQNLGIFLNPYNNKNITYPDNYNNIITFIISNKLYILGGIIINDSKSNINQYMCIVDLNNDYSVSLIQLEKDLKISSFAKAFVSKNINNTNVVYLCGVKYNEDNNWSIYKLDIKDDNNIIFSNIIDDIKITQNFDTINTNEMFIPNGGGIFYYNIESNVDKKDKTQIITEYITYMGCDDYSNDNSGYEINTFNITNKKRIFLTNTLKTNSGISIYDLFKVKNSNKNYYSVLYPQVITHFEINGFLFLVTGTGDILRVNNFNNIDENTSKYISPCYGLSKYEHLPEQKVFTPCGPYGHNTPDGNCECLPGYLNNSDGSCNKVKPASSFDITKYYKCAKTSGDCYSDALVVCTTTNDAIISNAKVYEGSDTIITKKCNSDKNAGNCTIFQDDSYGPEVSFNVINKVGNTSPQYYKFKKGWANCGTGSGHATVNLEDGPISNVSIVNGETDNNAVVLITPNL